MSSETIRELSNRVAQSIIDHHWRPKPRGVLKVKLIDIKKIIRDRNLLEQELISRGVDVDAVRQWNKNSKGVING